MTRSFHFWLKLQKNILRDDRKKIVDTRIVILSFLIFWFQKAKHDFIITYFFDSTGLSRKNAKFRKSIFSNEITLIFDHWESGIEGC